MASSGGLCELGEVVAGADQRPFGLHFLDASEQELSKPSCLLDLSEHRLDDLLPEPVATPPAGPPELIAHRLAAQPSHGSLRLVWVFGASGCDVSTDRAVAQSRKVRVAQLAGVGWDLL